MEALIFNGKTLSIEYQKNYPIPKITDDDQVIVKVKYAGMCGTDVHIIEGSFPALKDRPFPLGHECSGVVHAVGKNAIFKVGQKVSIDPNCACQLCDYCRTGIYQNCKTGSLNGYLGIYKDGVWAEYCVVPQQQVYAIPDGITSEQACLAEPYSCVAHGFNRAAPLKIGQKILIIGAGVIGNLYATGLHHQGHREVTISEMNEKRLEIVRRLETGFRLVNPKILAEEKELYDVIIDCTGVTKVLETSMQYMKPGGKYVIFGCCPPSHTASINAYEIFDKEISIIGVRVNCFSFYTAIAWIKAMGDRYVEYHKLGIKTYRLSEYKTALSDVKAGLVSKVVFKISHE